MSATLRRLSGQDALFVYAETPTMPMHTMGTTLLDPSGVDGPFGHAEIVETVASRIHLMPPFRQRLLEVPLGLGHPVLVDDPDFRVEHHMHHRHLPEPGNLSELAELVGDLAGTPLDRSKPLWEMWVVEGLATGEIALITKMHHCMIDGASGSSQMAQLMDLEPNPAPAAPALRFHPPPLPSAFALAGRSLGSRLVSPIWLGRLALKTARGALDRRRAELEIARENEGGASDTPPFFEAAPETPWSGALTEHRSVAYASAPLADLKLVKNVFGVTVNDAVLAACSLAVSSYLSERGELPPQPLHCFIPVSLKSAQEKTEFSNKVSMMTVKLPTQLGDPAEVIEAVHRETLDAKRVFEAVSDDLVPQWLEMVPPILSTVGARAWSDLRLADYAPPLANLVVSNMMGPPVPLYFGGARVTAVYPMGPVGEGLGLNLTVLSNMGRLDLGVLACRERVPDPSEIADAFTQAVADLKIAAEKKLSV
jgi:diacylglycerol O-acyltransferase